MLVSKPFATANQRTFCKVYGHSGTLMKRYGSSLGFGGRAIHSIAQWYKMIYIAETNCNNLLGNCLGLGPGRGDAGKFVNSREKTILFVSQ
jgi:hypothetical protein